MSDGNTDNTGQNKFAGLPEDPGRRLELAQKICKKHDVSIDCTRIEKGSQLVFSSMDTHIVKIFSPRDDIFYRNESIFLKQLYRKLLIRTPYLHASGYWEQYPYIIMEKIRGIPLDLSRQELSDTHKRHIVSQLGRAVRSLHDLPADLFHTAPFQWLPLIHRQREHILDNHKGYGTGQEWVSQIVEYMDSFPLDVHDPSRIVPLHTELMYDHLFVEKEGITWNISGLIDFEPSMVGHAEYDFCAVGLFITQGDKDLFRLFLSSYGYRNEELNEKTSRRIMMFLLLHRYCDLTWFLSFIPEQLHLTELRQLEQYWFGL